MELITATAAALDALGLAGLHHPHQRPAHPQRAARVLRLRRSRAGRRCSSRSTSSTRSAPTASWRELSADGADAAAVLGGILETLEPHLADGGVALTVEAITGILPDGIDTDAIAALEALAHALDSLPPGVGLRFDPTLVRGMGYYTGTIFEIAHPGSGSSVGGGGRYDGMIGRFLGTEVPAVRLLDRVRAGRRPHRAAGAAMRPTPSCSSSTRTCRSTGSSPLKTRARRVGPAGPPRPPREEPEGGARPAPPRPASASFAFVDARTPADAVAALELKAARPEPTRPDSSLDWHGSGDPTTTPSRRQLWLNRSCRRSRDSRLARQPDRRGRGSPRRRHGQPCRRAVRRIHRRVRGLRAARRRQGPLPRQGRAEGRRRRARRDRPGDRGLRGRRPAPRRLGA